MRRNGSSKLLILPIFPFPEVREMLFQRLLRCRCLSHRHHGKHRNPRIQLVLGNVLRHHCLLCCHDFHVIVWNYPSPVMLFWSGYEDLNLPGSDQFTMWGKMTPDEILTEHVVDIYRIEADFRDAFRKNLKTGTLGPDEVKQMLSRNKLQESGISLPYKKLLNMSNSKSFMHNLT